MASSQVFTDFSLGEVTPILQGRMDLADYPKALDTCENYYVLPQGGIQRRDGTKLVTTAGSEGIVRLVEFIYSRTEAYVLEFTNLKLRFFRFNPTTNEPELITLTGPATSIVTPYAEADLDDLSVIQNKDLLYIAHKNYAPRMLRRVAYNNWTITSYSDAGGVLNPTPTQNPTTTTTNQDATRAPYHSFNDENFAELFNSSAGRYGLTITMMVPVAWDPVTEHTILAFAHTWLPSDVGAIFQESSGALGSYKGYWIITSYVDPTAVKARMLTEAHTGAPYTTRIAKWVSWHNSRSSFPAAVSIHEQRLVYANTSFAPQTFWGSVPGQYSNFTLGSTAGDAYALTISTSDVSPIRWLLSIRVLLIGTENAEYRVTGFDTAISPTSYDIKLQTRVGSGDNGPRQVGQSVFFIDRTKRKLLRYDFVNIYDNYTIADVTHIAEHITEGGIKKLCWQSHPRFVLWAVRTDGQLVGFTYAPELRMNAWQRVKTDGYVKSIASIPDATGGVNRTWIAVQRIANVNTLKALYKLDGSLVRNTSEDISVEDSIGGKTGTFWNVRDERTIWQDGLYGKCAVFNGDMERISIPPDAVPQSGDFSFSFRFRPASTITAANATTMHLFRMSTDVSTNDMMMDILGSGGNRGKLRFSVHRNAAPGTWTRIHTNGSTWNAGQWYHAVMTYVASTGTMKMYIDNVLQTETDTGVVRGTVLSTAATIASHSVTMSDSFAGAIEHFAIYSTELSASQVSYLYTADNMLIETFDDRYLTDSSVFYSGAAITTLTGLINCSGKSVSAKNGDTYMKDYIVSDAGEIVFASGVKYVYAGLPYTSLAKTMPVVAPPHFKKSFSYISARVFRMRDLQINNNEITFMQTDSEIDQAPPAFSGQKFAENLGADYDAQIELRQTRPYGGQILSLSGIFDIGNT